MKLSKKHIGAAGIAGAVLACLPCCIPLTAPVLALFGISTLSAAASGWYMGMAGVFVIALAALLLARHRLAARRCLRSQCDCRGACRVDLSSTRSDDRS